MGFSTSPVAHSMPKSIPSADRDIGEEQLEALVYGLTKSDRIKGLIKYLLRGGCVPHTIFTIGDNGRLLGVIDHFKRVHYVKITRWGRRGGSLRASRSIYPDAFGPSLRKRSLRQLRRHNADPRRRPMRAKVALAKHAKQALLAS